MSSWIQIPRGRLYTAQDLSIPLSKSIQDLRDLSARKGGLSKTVTIAGSRETHELLGFYFDVNLLDATFNHKVKVPAQVVQDGVIIMEGVLRLLSINKESPSHPTLDERVSYEVQILDESSTFFTDLGDDNLRDLDLSYLSHQLTAEEIIQSADYDHTNGYKYLWTVPVDNGINQYYPIDHFKPAIFAKTYWDAIFAKAGYTYQWDDLEEYRFHELLMPYTGGKLQPAEDDATALQASYENDGLGLSKEYLEFLGPVGPTSAQNIQPDFILPDRIIENRFGFLTPLGIYNLPIVQDIGEFTAFYDIEYRFKITNLGPNAGTNPLVLREIGGTPGGLRLKPLLRLRRSLIPVQATGFNHSDIPNESFNDNQVLIPGGIGQTQTTTPTRRIRGFLPSNEIPYTPDASPNFGFQIGAYAGGVNPANAIRFVDSTDPSNVNPIPVRIEIEVISAEIRFVPTVTSIGEGAIINMNKVITDLSQREFIRGIMTHFNLMFDVPDDADPQKIKIVGRDTFYDQGREIDWTKKLILDREASISFAGEQVGKRQIVSWSEGSDILNLDYRREAGATFGQQGFVFSDEFARGVNFIRVPWEPTIIIKNNYNMYVLGLNGFETNTGPRLVYDGGKRDVVPYPILKYGSLPPNWQAGGNSNVQIAQVYTYAGHFDDPLTPEWDLNFGPAAFYGYNNWINITNVNQFSLHWARTFQQLEEGRILEGFFNITPDDFREISLNERIWIFDSWWNIVDIIDYNAANDSPTRVKLISIDPNQPFDIPFTFTGVQDPPNLGPGTSVNEIDPVNPFSPIRITRSSPIRDLYDEVGATTNVIETTGPVIVVGPGNVVADEAGPLVAIGGDNVINNPGPTLLIGEGVNTVPTDIGPNIYIGGGTYIDDTGVYDRRIKIVEGGIDEVLRHFKFNDQDVIDPGEDVIKFYGGVNPQRHVFECGEDDVRWTWNPPQQ